MLSVASMMSLGDIDNYDDEAQTINPILKRGNRLSGSVNELGLYILFFYFLFFG